MAARVMALVKGELLLWARTSAGLTIEEAAKKIQAKPERLAGWEKDDSHPSVAQLRKLGKAYKRPIAVFYLPEPPRDFQPLRDFRRLPGQVAEVLSSDLRFAVRTAQARREQAEELHREIVGAPPSFVLTASLSDDPEAVGQAVRKSLGVSIESQKAWSPGYATLGHWRTSLENAGILVFQMKDVEPGEARGFSISADVLPAIVVNIKDSPRARCFTMMHELAHLMLREGGLCDLDESGGRPPEKQSVEIYCNRVAGATLVPLAVLLAERLVCEHPRGPEWADEDIRFLADRFGVSREVLLRRLLVAGRTTEAFYRAKRRQFLEEYQATRREEGFPPPHRLAISTAGPLFVRLVLEGYHGDAIGASEVAELLGVKLKHLQRIETEVLGAAASGAAS